MTTIAQYLGDKAEYVLNFKSPKIPKEHLHLPGPEVSLDNPESVKVPFGVAMALTVVLCGVGRALGKV